MNVILLERIRNLGELGEQVQVKPGYGRNYLLPQGKAAPATEKNIKYFEERRAEFEQAEKSRLDADKQRAEALSKLHLKIEVLVGDEGKLYGSVGAAEIVAAIEQAGLTAQKHEVQLPESPFRAVGDYDVTLHLHHGDVVATTKLSIIAQE